MLHFLALICFDKILIPTIITDKEKNLYSSISVLQIRRGDRDNIRIVFKISLETILYDF